MSAIAIRRARPDEIESMGALSALAFPYGPEDAGERAKRYRETQQSRGIERFLAERDGRVVGQYANLPLRFWLGGIAARAGGLAGVAVAPEARRTGIAKAIVRAHLGDLRGQGAAWSLLYPFAARFYARLGWGIIAHRARYRFAPAELPAFPERALIERISLEHPEAREEIAACYERSCARVSGSLSRAVDQIDPRWRGDRAFCAVVRSAPGGRAPIEGYLVGHLHAPSPRPQRLVVPELVAETPRAERALYGFLSAQADQIDAIELDCPIGPPSALLAALIERALPHHEPSDAPDEHQPAGTIWTGAMARVIDLAGALAGRGWPAGATARIAFAADDAELPDQAHPVTLFVERGAAHVEPGRAAGAPLIRGKVGPLSQLLCGALDLAGAHRLGMLTVEDAPDPQALAALATLIALPPPYPLVTF